MLPNEWFSVGVTPEETQVGSAASLPGPFIESLNAQLRKVTRTRGAFPTDDSVRKILYLATQRASKKWTMPIRNWPEDLNFFSIVFEGRISV